MHLSKVFLLNDTNKDEILCILRFLAYKSIKFYSFTLLGC